MINQGKPRICEILGVEPGEKFRIDRSLAKFFRVDVETGWVLDGYRMTIKTSDLFYILNHPEAIVRKPQFTEEEIAMAKNLIELFDGGTISKSESDRTYLTSYGKTIGLRNGSFPSIRPGQSENLRDICGED